MLLWLGEGELQLYLLSTTEVYLTGIQLTLVLTVHVACCAPQNILTTWQFHTSNSHHHKHNHYIANYSPLLTAVYFQDLHTPSWPDVEGQEERGTVNYHLQWAHHLHSSLNMTCIQIEMV